MKEFEAIWLAVIAMSCPIPHFGGSKPIDHPVSGSAAPSKPPSEEYNELTNDFKFSNTKQADSPLSVSRQVSNIPNTVAYRPEHQPNNQDKWVYPSEQQYYNAMKKKGYNPDMKDVPSILFIHNMVNEQGWRKVKEWESIRGIDEPKLKKFQGRPKDISPKAFISHHLFGYSLPFDRHDWIVERSNGKEVRYVIDFYKGAPVHGVPVSIYLDVRPACDSSSAIIDRLSRYYREDILPNIKSIFK